MSPRELERLIEEGLEGAEVRVEGEDGRHFEAVVVSARFEGLSMLQQHRLVYAAIGDRFTTDAVHALSLRTFTPAQWAARPEAGDPR